MEMVKGAMRWEIAGEDESKLSNIEKEKLRHTHRMYLRVHVRRSPSPWSKEGNLGTDKCETPMDEKVRAGVWKTEGDVVDMLGKV